MISTTLCRKRWCAPAVLAGYKEPDTVLLVIFQVHL